MNKIINRLRKVRKGAMFIIEAPSGTGKGTVIKELLKNDLDAAEIFNKAIELADIRHRHYYYREEFLNQTF